LATIIAISASELCSASRRMRVRSSSEVSVRLAGVRQRDVELGVRAALPEQFQARAVLLAVDGEDDVSRLRKSCLRPRSVVLGASQTRGRSTARRASTRRS
jgi:hypothetical protein